MEGTFNYSPKNIYHFYNIIGIEKDNGNKIPLMFIFMTSKSYQLYLYIFNYFKKFINEIYIKFSNYIF